MLFAYVGCGNEAGEIQVFSVDRASGGLALRGLTSSGSSTSWLAAHPSGRFVYTTQNRTDQLSAFAVDPSTGGLTPLGRAAVPSSAQGHQSGPSHVAVDATGRFVMAANYRGHNVVVFAIESDGRIGPLLQNLSEGQHAHQICLDASNRIAFVPYLGSDRIGLYRFDPGTSTPLTPNDPPRVTTPSGEGPRHLTFHPNGHWAYLVTELGGSVFFYELDGGALIERQQLSSLPEGYAGQRWGAEIQVHPSGRFLYASNRAHDSLALFAIDDGGRLSLVGHEPTRGRTPRHFSIDPGGNWLFVANQDSANVVTFAVDDSTGRLTHVHTTPTPPNPYYVALLAQP